MCSIYGLLGEVVEKGDSSKIYSSFNTLRKRGPDRSLTILNPDSFLGFHRLAINGLDVDGDQPFYMLDGERTFYLVCNGEIYNFRELIGEYKLDVSLHGSDCAVILPLLKLFNYDLDKLNKVLIGEYSFAIVEYHDHKLKQLFLSTDPLSVRPVFIGYSQDFKSFGFSSLLSGIAPFFKNVVRFDQKTILNWTPGQEPLKKQYWPSVVNADYNSVSKPSDSDYAKAISIFENAVRHRLISDRPIGCLLSGGLDSSVVCAVAAKIMADEYPGKKLKSFSIGMKEGTDIVYAKRVAEHLNKLYGNIEHEIIYFTPQEGLDVIDTVLQSTETYDITTIRASVGQYLLGKYISAKTDIKVVLNGDGADECQMGYLYFYNHPDLKSAQEDHYRLLDEIHLFDGLRVDRAISCHGLEARVPFLDREFVDYFRGLPASWKVPTADSIEKNFFRTAFAKSKFGKSLPEDVLWRKKEAFSDGVSGKEKSWFQWVQEFLNEKVSDKEFELKKDKLHPTIVAPSKESYYFMRAFQGQNGDQWQVIPHYWLPRWSGNHSEPSARVLKVYDI
jgi:asparagine synthase (glutamine-hydrolysing)